MSKLVCVPFTPTIGIVDMCDTIVLKACMDGYFTTTIATAASITANDKNNKKHSTLITINPMQRLGMWVDTSHGASLTIGYFRSFCCTRLVFLFLFCFSPYQQRHFCRLLIEKEEF